MLNKLIIETPLNSGYRAENRKTRCIPHVLQNHNRILQLREIGMSWSDIAVLMKMSTASLRTALKQISALKLESEFDKPKRIHPKLMLHFNDEPAKEQFIEWTKAL